jgi:Glycosyltransferase family 87/Dolichyl-phosphate-mannose-protein mannosyltransferase
LAPVTPLNAVRPRLAARWRSLEGWVGTRSSASALFVLALAVFAIQSIVLPVYPGRDMSRYLETFVQLGYHVPVYPAVLNTRGPLAALGVAVPLEVGGWAAEVWLAVLYALSIVAWGRIALTFGSRAAILTSALLLVYPGYGILFHQLSSDALFAAAFAGWALLLSAAIQRPSVKAFLLVGLGAGALVLVRPANQVLIVMALLPLLLRAPWRDRLAWLAAYFGASVVVTQGWKALAQWRYGDAVALKPSTTLVAIALVTLPLLFPTPWRGRLALLTAVLVVAAVGVVAVKGWPGQSPTQYARATTLGLSNQFLYRAFELDRIVSPENGPASRKVARVVRRDLLTREPYRSYGVDVHEFFSSGSDRVFGDLTGTVNGADLAAATREAIRRHPATFATSISNTLWDQLTSRVFAPEPTGSEGPSRPEKTQYIVVNGRRLPRPTEGQPIPASAIGPILWTPGGQASEVWRSPTRHRYVFSDRRDQRRAEKFGRDVGHLAGRIPARNGNQDLVHRLNQASHVFPPFLVWIVIGFVALAVRRPRGALIALAPTVAGLVVIVATSLVVPAVAEYAAPVSPAFLLLTAAGLVGARASDRRSLRSLQVPTGVKALASTAAALVAAAWAAQHYIPRLHSALTGGQAPHDLAVFLRAASKLVHLDSPYAFRGDETYAYPPLLGFLAVPFHALGTTTATVAWMLCCLAAVGGALWLLGVRDWRCYALSAAFPSTASAVDLGTVAPFLLLAVAAAWRWRGRTAGAGVATAAAIALKVFLWPLVAWLAFTRRLRAGAIAIAATAALVLLPWAVIAFAGLADYPGLLRRLSDEEATSSYSVVALVVRAHLPQAVGIVFSLATAAALLGAAAWVAHDERVPLHNRDSATLTLALAAALAASPIVWIHYFLLLIVPIALTSPSLSLLWFVPFAYYPLGETAWPTGDARKLGLALVTTLAILALSLRHDLRKAEHRDPPAGEPAEPHSPAVTVKTRTRVRSLLSARQHLPKGAP